MPNQVFEIDTRAFCLLCVTSCDKGDVAAETQTFLQRQTAFKMLLRYLKINVLKLAPFASSFGTFLDGSEYADTNLKVLLCDNCSEVTTEFLDMFQIFDEARLRLDAICGALLNRIREGEEDQRRLENYRKSLNNVSQLSNTAVVALLNASLAESLRNETKQKCVEKLNKSLPKVSLLRGGPCKKRKLDLDKSEIIISEKCSQPTQPEKFEEASPELGAPNNYSLVSRVEGEDVDLAPEDSTDTDQPEIEDNPPYPPMYSVEEQLALPSLSPTTIDLILSPEESKPPSPPEPALASSPFMGSHNFPSTSTTIPCRNTSKSIIKSVDMKEKFETCSCNLCSQEFILGHSTIKQQTLSSGTLVLMLQCKYCEKSFSMKAHLRIHLVNSHPIIVFSRELPGGTSESEFSKIVDTLERRTRECVGTGVVKFQCPCCPKIFENRMYIRSHILHWHFEHVLKSLKKKNVDEHPVVEAQIPGEIIRMGVPNLAPTFTPTNDAFTSAAPVVANLGWGAADETEKYEETIQSQNPVPAETRQLLVPADGLTTTTHSTNVVFTAAPDQVGLGNTFQGTLCNPTITFFVISPPQPYPGYI